MLTTPTKHYFLKYANFLALLLLTAACTDHEPQPETDPLPVAAVNERLLLESTQFYPTKAIEYNPDKTVKKFQIGQAGNVIDVAYTSTTVIYSMSLNGKIVNKYVYEMENKVAKKVTFYQVDNNGNEISILTVAYSYKKGKLFKEIYSGEAEGYIEHYYDDLNENLKYSQSFDKNGVPETKTTFEYTNQIDKSGSLTQDQDQSNGFMDGTLFPRKFKYLIKKRIMEGASPLKSDFTYVLDQQGYVTSGTRTDDNGDVTNWTNTWQ
ncbi:hypothetical protein LZD49_24830 [Dyadobacter sp. CY261]|uniref:hypothetical protein n=1 Tax=Dyadobacter sp. CY261 TaxID=2907203 RepID=UPI001F1FFEEF|nr:hypothetical protein [Dyadobacter sp. CY261]MCF0073728.1 hypothetical protein [Dyadobacter sp. CY261]